MNVQGQGNTRIPLAADCAEAAAWIAKLHGEDRSPELEAGLRRWLAASETHRVALEMANELWTECARLPKDECPIRLQRPRVAAFTGPKALAAAAMVAAMAIGAAFWLLRNPPIETHVGELRNIVLEDGSRVALNTATRIQVRYDKSVRSIELERGEAFFDVARRADRPFVVTAAGRRITALGTSFVVRREAENVAVTLVDGKVAVSGHAPGDAFGNPRVMLAPGERLMLTADRQPRRDRPPIAKVTAWQRGQVILDHTSLADAAAEMNRYSPVQLAIESTAAAAVEVTGVFRAGDSREFARAVVESYGLELRERTGKLVLSGVPNQR
jgi:transmembrane sensor